MQKFRRRLARKLDQRGPLHFLADFNRAHHVGIGVAHALWSFFELAQRVVKVAGQHISFFVCGVDMLRPLCFWNLGQALFNRPDRHSVTSSEMLLLKASSMGASFTSSSSGSSR